MDIYEMSYANTIQLIIRQYILKIEKDFDTTHEKAFIQAYDDMSYNISTT